MTQRVYLVDPCRFTRSALTQWLQLRKIRVEAWDSLPSVLPSLSGSDCLIALDVPGRDAVVRIHRAAGVIVFSRRELTSSRLLELVEGLDDAMISSAGPSASVEPGLSAREQQVLRGLASGASSRETAEHLRISAKTVEHHKANIYAKLGVQSQAQAVAVAMRQGLLGEGMDA